MSNRIHALATEMDGCTHVEEGQHVTRRFGDEGSVTARVELRGGTMDGDAFAPRRAGAFGQATEWREFTIGPDRTADYLMFQAEFEADTTQPSRDLEERAHACRLEYLQRVELGLRPLPPPEPEE